MIEVINYGVSLSSHTSMSSAIVIIIGVTYLDMGLSFSYLLFSVIY